MRIAFYKILVINILCINIIFAQSEKYLKLEPSIERMMQKYHCPGLSIAVVEKGKIVYAKGFGFADVSKKDSVTTNTLFQAASLSKTPTAFLTLQAVEKGLFKLDENANEYLSKWKIEEDKSKRKRNYVTLRGLLSHTAGVNMHGFHGYEKAAYPPSILDILKGEPPAQNQVIRLIEKPNFRFHYSGGGYMIVQEILEEKYQIPFETLVKDSLFAKIGMKYSTYETFPDSNFQVAKGYFMERKKLQEVEHFHPEKAAAGLWTTPSDLALFMIEIQKALKGKSVLLKKETAMLFHKRIMTSDFIGGDVALGFFVNHYGTGQNYFGHGGGNEGFTSEILIGFKEDFAVAIMCNGLFQKNITGDIIQDLLHNYWK